MISPVELFVIGLAAYLAAAVLALLFDSKPKLANVVSMASSAIASVAVACASAIVMETGKPVVLGPYRVVVAEAPLTVYIDSLSASFVFAVATLTFAISIFSVGYLKMFYGERSIGYFGTFYNAFIFSMIMTCCTDNVLWFLFFWELMTASSYFLVIYEDTPDVRRIGYLYFILMHVGFACIAVSLVLTVLTSGSWSLLKVDPHTIEPGVKTAILALALIGFGMKLGLVPLHVWLPEAHPAAPSNVSALLSGVMLSMGLYGLTRISLALQANMEWWYSAIAILAVLSVAVGVLCMPAQMDFKRLLAYSSIVEMGLASLSLSYYLAGSQLGLKAMLMHVVNQAYAKGALFALSGLLLYCAGTKRLSDIRGLWDANPLVAAVLLAAALDIMGLPPFGCFFSKAYIVLSGFNPALGLWAPLAASASLAIEVVCFAWFLRVVQHAVMGEPSEAMQKLRGKSPRAMLAGLLVLVLLCVVSGFVSLYLIGGVRI
ncbi:complex I subunit 5 family protein [Thermofilum pendens]|uniref:NADH dehydrogenase (Quinone) n=1 Tax=Thermofilum pendens (strain DSM 2475 / Hrk 5) TaxID=368408 RepID=A1RWL4_THEPD|nr:proton-conducting transporter membrane subunit [Thermofilum pendens]ABL77594.1 NADH dehydrogenase (quinone) [Thermofilum pendens Hrk 5]